MTLKKAIETNDYPLIVVLMGYTSEEDFIAINKQLFNKIQNLKAEFPTIEFPHDKVIKDAISLYYSNQSSRLYSSKTGTGCAGGIGCFRTATDCNNQAEEDFAVASVACLSISWFPPGWAVCQGSAFLVEAATKMDCAYQLEKCCALNS